MRTNKSVRLLMLSLLAPLTATALGGSSAAQAVKTVYSFTANGNSQLPSLVTPAQGRDGKIYGTTSGMTFGTVFSLQASGVETDLFAFNNTDGAGPSGGLTLGTDGNFYGATAGGGASGLGTLYKISPQGSLSVLHDFTGGADGSFPVSAPIQASDGNFYGATEDAANFTGSTVYRYTPSGVFTTIASFG